MLKQHVVVFFKYATEMINSYFANKYIIIFEGIKH